MAEYTRIINDEQWKLVKRLLPNPKANPKGGRTPIDNRKVLEGILWVLRNLGFNSNRTEPVEVNGVEVMPFDLRLTLLGLLPAEEKKLAHILSEGNCVVQGWKDSRKTEITLMIWTVMDSEMHRRYTQKGAFGSYRTGICGAMAGIMLGRGMIHKKGVCGPELCVPAV